MILKCKQEFGDLLYLRNDPEQKAYFFCGLIKRPEGIFYELGFLGEIIQVYDFEVSNEKNPLMTMGIDKEEEDGN